MCDGAGGAAGGLRPVPREESRPYRHCDTRRPVRSMALPPQLRPDVARKVTGPPATRPPDPLRQQTLRWRRVDASAWCGAGMGETGTLRVVLHLAGVAHGAPSFGE